jgi:hypothetical protein
MVRGRQEGDSGVAGYLHKERTELAIAVTDEEARGQAKGSRFPQLLSDPGIGGMASHPNMNDFSALQLDDEEGKEGAEEEIGDR